MKKSLCARFGAPLLTASALLLLAACGSSGKDDGAAAAPLPGVGASPTPAPAVAIPQPALESRNTAIGTRRLSKDEYRNTVRDLLGADALAGLSLPESSLVHSLANNQHVQQLGRADVEALERAADIASSRAMAALKLPSGCSTTAMPGDCIDRFLPGFLERAFRRPASVDETKRMRDFYTAQAPDGVSEALRGVVQAALISPSMLYRFEVGSAQGALSGYELASRLSYLLWASMPDDALLAAAKNNQLTSAAQIEAQVKRMLADAKAKQGATQFVREWLGTARADVMKKGADLRAGLNEATLQADLEAEHVALIGEAMFAQTGSLANLLAGKYTYVTANGAKLQGLPAVTSLTRVSTDGQPRRGVLTQPLLIAAHSKEAGASVVQMGRFVNEHLRCLTVPPPPPGIDTTIPNDPATANLSYREKLTKLTSPAACAGCHQVLNPPGFAYMSFDPLGRFASKDARGVDIDTKGEITGLDGKTLAFLGAPEMIDGLAASVETRACFARRYVEYAFGRTLNATDVAMYQRTAGQFAAQDNFAAFVTALVTAPEFAAAGPRN
jgi:Protein of unknown function (DUF1592)/Protein of unknown function (DUF1588)/Protein of unknown function (DUF1595)/Protein of unknown function (DUF1587)/Protein of unknown function (DUF1585)